MQSSGSVHYESEVEETSTSTLLAEEELNRDSPNMQAISKYPPNTKALRNKSHSLHMMDIPKKEELNFLTTLITKGLENKDQDVSEKTIALQNSARLKRKQERLNTLLIEALRYREVAEIERLILAGANPNATCCMDGISACHLAAMRPDGALEMLISHGAEKNRPDQSGRTPLHLAAWAGHLRQMAMLLGFTNDLTNEITTKTTSNLAAKIRNRRQYMKHLVNVECNYKNTEEVIPQDWMDNSIDHDCKELGQALPVFEPGWMPLHAACARAKYDCTWLLLAAGADPSLRDVVGRTPLDIVGSTYYSEGDVDPESFAKIVSMLAGQKNNISINNRKTLDTPLHTAVELESVSAVLILLDVHVPITWLNKAGLTPLHVCVKNKSREVLQVLLYKGIALKDDTNLMAAVDVTDKDGNTVLHSAVLEDWDIGVCVALEAGANIAVKNNNGETALHLAAEIGNIKILNEILIAVPCDDIINLPNSEKETPLIKAVCNGHTKCVKRILENRASIKEMLQDKINVFHIAAEKGFTDVLQVLLDHKYTLSREMINYLTENQDGFGPIHYAVQNNHLQCVKLLLSRNAFRSLKSSLSGTYNGSTPLHIAAIYNHVDIAKVIIKNNPDTLLTTNGQNWTALHSASYYGSRDVILLLLKEGANLAHVAIDTNKKEKITSMDLIMNNLSKPTEFLHNIFDDYIFTNDRNIQDPNCKVTVDYQALVPKSDGKEQMKVIEALLKTGDRHGQRNLLVHPLLESFLHLKWKALLPFFYSMIIVYGVYVTLLTIYVLAVFSKQDDSPILVWVEPKTLAVFLYITSVFVVFLEALYVHINYKYFIQLETWIKFGSMILALSLPNSVATKTEEQGRYARHIATTSLLMSWLEMMFLLSRFPNWGYYVLMFGKVCCTVLKILLTFSFLIVGFSLSFMIQYHHKPPYEDIFAAFTKVMAMLASEFDYGNLIENFPVNRTDSTEPLPTSSEVYLLSVFVFRSIFLLFVIITAIVLVNLMVGVAVNDLHYLQVLGNVRRLTKQVEFLVSFDRLLYNRYVRLIMPKSLEKLLLKRKTILSAVVLRPRDTKSEYYEKLPAEMREAIFERAQLRKKQIEDEMGSQTYKKKLDEIHKATVKMKPQKEPADTTKFVNFGLTSRLNNDSKTISNLDTEVVNGNKNNDEFFMELKSSIGNLEAKVDVILNKLLMQSR